MSNVKNANNCQKILYLYKILAIAESKKISFKYFDYDVNKRKHYRDGIRTCSPYALTWSDERYYLVAYYEKYDGISNFRVDRMESVEILDDYAEKYPDGFSLSAYIKSTFSMFSGKAEEVKMRFDKSLINAIIDRFGKNTGIFPDGDNHFIVRAQIKTEKPEPFFGWLFQFGKMVEILELSSFREIR